MQHHDPFSAPAQVRQIMTDRPYYLGNHPQRRQALNHFKRILFKIKEQNPYYIGVHLAYARILRDLGETAEARAIYEFVEKHPNASFRYHWNTYLCHGICLSEENEETAAVAILKKITDFDKNVVPLSLQPTTTLLAEAHNAIAVTYMKQEEFNLSCWHFKKATMLNPVYAPAWSGLGKVYQNGYQLNKNPNLKKKAEECFAKAKDFSPPRYKQLHPPQDPPLPLVQTALTKTGASHLLFQKKKKPDFDLNSLDDFPKLSLRRG
ncbi:MAG TPA: hypothetical protein VLH77_01960 [Gammaproteobacteria bacterium]|nr:hypothetical protein [Gammaproteobacteria bacterium]